MGAPIVHWEINAKDAKRLWEFYVGLFDWKVNSDNPMNYGLVSTGSKLGIGGGIGQTDPNTPAPSVTFYIQVDDVQKELDKVGALGGRIVMPSTEIPNMVTFGLFADPEGNVIGLLKSVESPPKKVKRPRPRRKAKARKVRKAGRPRRARR